MLHVEAETCSSACRSMLALRRASMMSSKELLDRAERAVPPQPYEHRAHGASGPIENYRDLGFDEYQPSGPVFFGADIGIPRDVPTYELDPPEEYDRAPAVIAWMAGGFLVAIGLIMVWMSA